MITVFFTIIGVIVGSFLTVVITRYDSDETIVFGRSHCRKCDADIRWYDNIPLVSFVLLRGKCRLCDENIGYVYPVTELLTGVVFFLTFVSFCDSTLQGNVALFFYTSIFSLLIIVLMYDFRTMYIPMKVAHTILFLIGFYILVSVFLFDAVPLSGNIVSITIGGVLVFSFFFALSYFSDERWMGKGDAIIGLIGGLLIGWPSVLFFLTVAFGIGAFVGIFLILLKIKKRTDAVPFAPFLVVGIFVTVFMQNIFPGVALLLPYF